MKILALTSLIFTLSLAIVGPALANEGRVVLKNGSLECEGVSIWRDERYRINGRCSGLVYPYRQQIDSYVLWVQDADGSNTKRVDSIDVGYFDGSSTNSFSRVFITAETASSPKNPGDIVLASGTVAQFDFNTNPKPQTPVTPLPTPLTTPRPTPTSRFSNVSRLLLAIPIIILFLGIGVIVIIILSRRG